MSDLDSLFGMDTPPVESNEAAITEFNPESAKENEVPSEAPTPEKKKGGRPRKSVKLVRVDTRLAPDDLEKVKRLAERTGHNESAILRELIILGLRQKNAR